MTNRTARKTRRIGLWIGIPVVFSLIVLTALFAVRYRLHNAYCIDKTSSIYPGTGQVHVVINEEACSGFGASDVISVNLVRKYLGLFNNATTIFKYDPSEFSGPMKVTWIRPDALELSVDRVQFIERQTSGAYGVLVVYRIGAVGNPVVGAIESKE